MLLNTQNTFDQFKMMGTRHLIFGYKGTLTNELVTAILQLSDTKLKELKASFKIKKAVINILIECLQNVLYHAESTESGGNHCIFLLGQTNDRIYVRIGNYVQKENESHLKSRLDSMNALEAEEIHNRYLEVLDQGQISAKGGAGLGILRILKDSGQPVSYEFHPVDDSKSFFCLEVNVVH